MLPHEAIQKLANRFPRPTARDQRAARRRALWRDREHVLELRASGASLAAIAESLRQRGTAYRSPDEPLTPNQLSTLLYRTGLNTPAETHSTPETPENNATKDES